MDKSANSKDGSQHHDNILHNPLSPKRKLREEPWLEDIDDKNYKKLILHLNLHTANESNFQNLLKNMDNEIQNALKTSKKIKQTTTSTITSEKNDHIRSRDPRCRERVVSYLETVSINCGNGDQKPNTIEPSRQLLQQNFPISKPPLEQNKQPYKSKSTLLPNKQLSSSTTHFDKKCEKNEYIQKRDPNCRERIMHYLEKMSILGKNEQKSNKIEPSGKFTEQNKQTSGESLKQNKQPSGEPLEQNRQPSGKPSEYNKKFYGESLEQNKQLSVEPLEHNKQPYDPPLEQNKNNSEQFLERNKLTSRQPLKQNEQPPRTSLYKNKQLPRSPLEQPLETNKKTTILPVEVLKKKTHVSEKVQDEKNEINQSTINKNSFSKDKKYEITKLNNMKHNLQTFRENIVSKYNQCFYRCPRNMTHYSGTPWDNKRPYYSWRNKTRLFNPKVNNSNDIRDTVESMLNSLDNSSKTNELTSPVDITRNLKNTETCFSLRQKNIEIKAKRENELKSQKNVSAKHNLSNSLENKIAYISEVSNSEALLNILSKINKFHSQTVHQNQETALSKLDEDQALQTFPPYQNPVNPNQTKGILIMQNEDKKELSKLDEDQALQIFPPYQNPVKTNQTKDIIIMQNEDNKLSKVDEDQALQTFSPYQNPVNPNQTKDILVIQNEDKMDLSKLDEDQALQTFFPYQNPVKTNQTKDILIIQNEDKKKLSKLDEDQALQTFSPFQNPVKTNHTKENLIIQNEDKKKLSKLDEDQALQTFLPYQNPVKNNQAKDIIIMQNEDNKKLSTLNEDQALQTSLPCKNNVKTNQKKDILIILNEDKKKIITLNDSEGFSMLSEKLMNSLIKDLYFKDLLDNSSLLNYQIYNTKFNEWVDIDDLESFKLSDGVILKAVVGLLQRKRKKASKNQGKEKKQKLNFNSEVQSEHSQSERMLLDDSVENKYQNTTESLENRRDKLFQELTNSDSKSQNITTQRDQSEYESKMVTPNTNYLDGLKDFIECVTNKKNLLKNIDIESIVSKEKIVNYESNDTLVKKNIRESTFNLVIPPQLKEALIQHYEIKPRHPIQYLGDVAKNMHWGIPVYNLIQESRNIDTSFSFLYSVTINDVQVVAKEPAPNKKQGRKLAAVTCLEKLRLFKIP